MAGAVSLRLPFVQKAKMLRLGVKVLAQIRRSSVEGYLKKWPFIFIGPFVVAYIAFFLFPLLYSLYISFFEWNAWGEKVFIGFSNYGSLFTKDTIFVKSLANTFIIALFVIPIVMVVGMVLANILLNGPIKGKTFFRTANYLPYITTPVAVGIIFSLLFDQKIGLANYILVSLGIFDKGINWMLAPGAMQKGLLIFIIVWQWTGYYTLMYSAGITNISPDVYEAAKVDGAGSITTFVKITVPLLNKVTYFLGVTSIIYCLQLLDQPYILLRGLGQDPVTTPERPITTVLMHLMDQGISKGRFGYGAAMTYTMFIFILIFTFIGMKIMKGGLDDENS
ncbi:MAG: sugar ABC transporter permease [Clostridia bacterium]